MVSPRRVVLVVVALCLFTAMMQMQIPLASAPVTWRGLPREANGPPLGSQPGSREGASVNANANGQHKYVGDKKQESACGWAPFAPTRRGTDTAAAASWAIFTVIKDMPRAPHQADAVRSWRALTPRPHIVLVSTNAQVEQWASELGSGVQGLYMPPKQGETVNDHGTPLLSAVFALVLHSGAIAPSPLYIFSNADILLPQVIVDAAVHACALYPAFLLSGRRWDMDRGAIPPETISNMLQTATTEKLITFLDEHKATMRDGSLKDWFVFTPTVFPPQSMPPFAIGRTTHDDWMIRHAVLHPLAYAIDSSAAVPAVHLNHDYSHVTSSRDAYKGPEMEQNNDLCPRYNCRRLSDLPNMPLEMLPGAPPGTLYSRCVLGLCSSGLHPARAVRPFHVRRRPYHLLYRLQDWLS